MTADPFAGLPGALRRLMEARELTQTQLADLAAVRQPRISDYLTGKREPSTRMLARMLLALDATVADLAAAMDAEVRLMPPLRELAAVIARQEREIARLEGKADR